MRHSWNTALLTGIIVLGTTAGISLFADADPTVPTVSGQSVSTVRDVAMTISLSGTSNDGGSIVFATTTAPSHGVLSDIVGNSITYTPEAGYVGSDSFQFSAVEGATSSAPATITVTIDPPLAPTGTAHIVLRDGGTIATSSDVRFGFGTTTITTTAGAAFETAASSTLAILTMLDASSNEFAISDLQYNAGFGAFYLRCITLASTTTPDCDNWQYTVNGVGPAEGMDKHVVHDGDTIYVYFAAPHIFSLSATSTPVNAPITVTAQKYDPVTGSYGPAAGLVIGAVTVNPDFSVNEFATTTTDVGGLGSLTLSATGTYQVGLRDDFYFPTETLTVTEAAAGSTGGGVFSGGTDPHAQTSFDIPRALAYLAAQQKTDGSFGNDYITDWAALALANYPGSARDRLKSYLLSHAPSLVAVTDRERHAMALAALGINPFNGTQQDLIAPIISAFDGVQVGDSSLITDDIFSLFPLLHTGHVQFEPMIRSIAKNIIAKQKPDGSWENSADVTAAAMQALGPLFTVPGYGGALGKGAGYLASTEQADGGWSNPDSTSWVMTMISSVREGDPARAPVFVSASGKTPADALNLSQQSDGGVRPMTESADTRTWSTAYAIVAASGKSWISLVQDFSGPSGSGTFSGGTDPYGLTQASTTPAATSTPSQATSTPAISLIASSTLPASTTPVWTDSGTTTRALTPPPPKKPKVRHVITNQPLPRPQATTSETQTAASASANTGFFARVFGWFRAFLPW